jgi:hypothetical protein
VKNNEKVWKIAIQSKNVENSRLYQQIKVQKEAKKVYESKLLMEESRTFNITRRMTELEKLETQMLEKLRQTHNSHLDAYAEMQKVYESRPKSRNASPLSPAAHMSNNVSPFMKKK